MTYLRVRSEDGEGGSRSETTKLSGPGGKLRIGVGDPLQGRSSIWVIEGPKGKSDIYVGNRDIMAFQKVSLHESGVWRFAWTSGQADLVLPSGMDRVLDRWQASAAFGAGWSVALRIFVAEEDTHTVAPVQGKRKSRKAIRWLPRPSQGGAVVLQVIVAKPDQGEVLLQHAHLIDLFFSLREDGEQQVCLLIASYVENSENDREWQRQTREQVIDQISVMDPGLITTTSRMTVFGHQNDGVRAFWDFGIP